MSKEIPITAIQELQEYVAHKIKERGFDDEGLHERLLLLVEEVGELVKTTRKMSGMYVDEKRETANNAGEEIADVLNMIFAVADKLGIDVASELKKKEAAIDKRTYKRSEPE